MYRVNIFLRIILFFLALIVLLLARNLVVLWVLLVLLTFLNYRKSKLLLLIDFVLIVLLAVTSRVSEVLIFYKLVYIVDMILTFIYFLNDEDKCLFSSSLHKKSNIIKKEDFYDKIYNDVYEENENKVKEKYGEIDFDNRIDYDLERKYLQSKIRFGTFSKQEKVSVDWNKIDTIVLMFSILIFLLLIIYR